MRDKLAELEGQNRARTKATIAALEGKVSNLEEQLDQEAKLVFFFHLGWAQCWICLCIMMH